MNGGGVNNEGIIGQKVVLKSSAGESILLKDNPTSNASTIGNLILGSDITITDTQIITLRYQEDITFSDSVGGWIIESSTGVSGSGGILPIGSATNDHIEWDGVSAWISSSTINMGDPGVNPLATTGKINLQNSGGIAWRDGLNAEDLEFKFDSNQNWFMDGLTGGGSALDLNNNHIIMDELPALGVPTGSANQIKIYAKEDTDTITKLFYKDSTDTERSVGIDGANKTLSNLTVPTSINTSLISDADGIDDLGSPTFHWDFTYTRAVQFNSNKTVGAVGITENAMGADSSGPWVNVGNVSDNFGIYERGTEHFRFSTPLSNVHEMFIGPQSFTSGEEYRIQMGENSNSSAKMYFIEGSGNDLILERLGTATTRGVQIRTDGTTRFLSTSVSNKFFTPIDANTQDFINVVDIKSNGGGGVTTGTIGELITGDGGFNYFMRDTLAWESDPDTKLVFDSSGITMSTDGVNDNIVITALGSSSDVTVNATDNLFLVGGLSNPALVIVANGNGNTTIDASANVELTPTSNVVVSSNSFIKPQLNRLGFQVTTSSITIGSEGTIQIPDSTSTTTSSATLDSLFGNADGCIGLGNSTSSNPSLWVKSSGTWRRAFLS